MVAPYKEKAVPLTIKDIEEQIPKKKEDYVIVPNCHENTVSDKMFETVKIKLEHNVQELLRTQVKFICFQI